MGWIVATLLSLGIAYPVYRTRLQRYRTSHTRFGNRRFDFDGRAGKLLKTWLLAWLLLLPTLGLAYVWYRAREFRHFTEKSRCGALSFASDLRTGAMIRIAVVFMLLTLLVVALLFATMLTLVFAVMSDPEWTETMQRVEGALPLGLGAAELAGYVVALVVFFPVVAVLRLLFLIHPLFRAILPSISVIGDEDYEGIAQSAQSIPRQGEGLADALDVGAV